MSETGRSLDRAHQLAEFLRARRHQLKPETVGISTDGQRRVPGLRREELARLAGLSPDYIMRLEQGRGQRPSDRVLLALAHALQLDRDATTLLFELGRPQQPLKQPGQSLQEHVRPELQELIDGWAMTPALVHGPRLDVLASNALGRALAPLAAPGSNMLWSAFLDPDDLSRYSDSRFVQALAVAYFRSHVGTHLDEPAVADLVDTLSERSAEFRRFWALHDVTSALVGEGPIYRHPLVGNINLRWQTFAVDGSDRQKLFLISVAPGSRDALALAQLASAVADGTYP